MSDLLDDPENPVPDLSEPLRRALGPVFRPILRPLARGLKRLWLTVSTPGLRMRFDRAGIRLRRLFEPVV